MKRHAHGTSGRYDTFSGDWLENQRRKGVRPGVFLPFQKRWCEHCQQHKPKGTRKAVKGWKCDDCLEKK